MGKILSPVYGIPAIFFGGAKAKLGTERRRSASQELEVHAMAKFALWVVLESKAGKEKELEEFLKSAQPLAESEPGTQSWYAVKLAPSKYAIFDTFANEAGRDAHLNGPIAKALFGKGRELLESDPVVLQLNVLASKVAGTETKKFGAHSS
jgi:quinol monooxygenase YgiN